MGYFIVTGENSGEHFVEAAVAGMAFVQIPDAEYVRVATQTDIESHWEEVQNAESAPPISPVFSAPPE